MCSIQIELEEVCIVSTFSTCTTCADKVSICCTFVCLVTQYISLPCVSTGSWLLSRLSFIVWPSKWYPCSSLTCPQGVSQFMRFGSNISLWNTFNCVLELSSWYHVMADHHHTRFAWPKAMNHCVLGQTCRQRPRTGTRREWPPALGSTVCHTGHRWCWSLRSIW